MQAVWFENGRAEVRQGLSRQPATRRSGALCGDLWHRLAAFQGCYGFRGIPGHEFVGTVIEAPTTGCWPAFLTSYLLRLRNRLSLQGVLAYVSQHAARYAWRRSTRRAP